MNKYYWCPSIEEEITTTRRYFGFRVFAFGAVVYMGKRSWIVRLAVRT